MKFNSVEEMIKDMNMRSEKEHKEHPFRVFFRNIWGSIEKAWEAPFEWYINTKHFIQRGKRGYADCDYWNLDYYIAEVMAPMLKQLKESPMRGIPNNLLVKHGLNDETEWNEKAESLAVEEYNKIFDDMIWTFQTCIDVGNDGKMLYIESKNEDEEFIKNYNMLTKEEMDRLKQGFDYFRDYFFDLWD